MSAVAHPQFALRPFLLEDTPLLAEIFRASVEELTADDYDEGQQEAWAAVEGAETESDDRLASVLRRFEGDERRVLWLIGDMPTATLPRGLVSDV